MEVLGTSGVGKSFGAREALRSVDLSLEGPRIVGILGPNGAGKTTLLEILEGLQRPSTGVVRLFGEPLGDRYPRHRVGVVLQKEFVLDRMTVGEYASLFAAIHGRSGDRVLDVAKLRPSTPIDRLSGGEAQRLFLAASTVHDPDLLFLDEPTAHLDPNAKAAIGDELRAMRSTRTVVMSTHDLHEAETVCDHLVFLVDGQVKASAPTSTLCPVDQAFRDLCGPRHLGLQ